MDELTPEQLQALLATIGDPGQLDDLDNQIAMAEKLRNYRADPTIDAGRLIVPNIGGAITQFMDNRRGAREAETARSSRDSIMRNQANRNQDFLEQATGNTPQHRMVRSAENSIDWEGPGQGFDPASVGNPRINVPSSTAPLHKAATATPPAPPKPLALPASPPNAAARPGGASGSWSGSAGKVGAAAKASTPWYLPRKSRNGLK